MKALRLLFLVILLLSTFAPMSGQQGAWFDIGIKGAYGLTMMGNNNVFDDRQIDHRISGGYGFGINLGVHFGQNSGVLVEYMRSTGTQKFDDESTPTTSLIDYQWSTNDVLLLYRFSGNGGYFEIGPKMSFLSDMTLEVEGASIDDVEMFYEDTWFSGVLGFGTYIAGSDLFTIQAGIRLHYQFGDMVSDAGETSGYPVGNVYDDYKKTYLIMAQAHIEFNYAFGRFAKNSCRDRWKLILF
jgi:hypothetical protein